MIYRKLDICLLASQQGFLEVKLGSTTCKFAPVTKCPTINRSKAIYSRYLHVLLEAKTVSLKDKESTGESGG